MSQIVLSGIPENLNFSVEKDLFPFQNCRSAIFQGFSTPNQDQKPSILISTRFGESSQVHQVKMPLGCRKQLTFFSDPLSSVLPCPSRTSPFSDCWLFLMANGGSEKFQLYIYDNQTGKFHDLSKQKEFRFLTPLWSNDGTKISFSSNKRNGKDADIYIADLVRKESDIVLVNERLLVQKGGTWFSYDFCQDGSQLLVKEYCSATKSNFYVVNVEKAEVSKVEACSVDASHGLARFSRANSNLIYFASDLGKEFSQLHIFDQSEKKVTHTNILNRDWDVVDLELTGDGKTAMAVVNENGFFKLYQINLADLQHKEIKTPKAGIIASCGFDQTDSYFAITLTNAQTAGDVYILDIATQNFTRWTESEIGGLNSESFTLPELIHYETFDKRQIPAFYYKAKPQSGKKSPVLIYIHGGPESQFLPGFIWKFQFYLIHLGISVIAPNVRGSAGYGRTYLSLDDKFLREDSVKDIGSLIDWCFQQPEIDSSRLCVEGGSYGGFMVLASMIKYADRLKTGMEIVGISNFVTFLENTSEYRRDLRREEYGDERDPKMREFLLRISPTTNAHLINRPMLIAQGANDPRVPESESEQIVKKIRENKSACWYILAKDEGHGFVKKSNIDTYTKHQMLFLQKYLIE